MKSILFVIFTFTLVTYCFGQLPHKYANKYDNVNVEDVLRNARILNGYIKCLLETGRCTPDGAELKRILPDALKTRCSSCTPRQKDGSMRIIAYLTANRPDVWRALLTKYDPKGIHYNHQQQFIRKPVY